MDKGEKRVEKRLNEVKTSNNCTQLAKIKNWAKWAERCKNIKNVKM